MKFYNAVNEENVRAQKDALENLNTQENNKNNRKTGILPKKSEKF